MPKPEFSAAPSPTPGPTTAVRAAFDSNGKLSLQWRTECPGGCAGVIYNIRRKLSGETGFSFVGTSGTTSFTDHTLPPDATGVQYTVYAQRGLAAGPMSSPLSVRLSQGRGGVRIEWQGEAPERAAA